MTRHFQTLLAAAALAFALPASAQDASDATTTLEDEVTSYGTVIRGQHDGFDAFFDGDFERAELEFEQEFKSLKRYRSSIENLAFNADVGADIDANASLAGDSASVAASSSQGAAGGGGQSAISGSTGDLANFRSGRRGEGRTVLTDGRVTQTDYAVAKYMTGLSELKLGKFDEAKDSLKGALHYDPKNSDARMRLGMLYLRDGDIDRAADHLERLERDRVSCEKRSCDELDAITGSAAGLAGQLMKTIRSQ